MAKVNPAEIMWPDEVIAALSRSYLSLMRHARECRQIAGEDNIALRYEAAVRFHDAQTIWMLKGQVEASMQFNSQT